MAQNYQYLNEWTIKNNYSLPLLLDIVENIGMKKIFTKLNLWQRYNNVQIKERDEWKIVFTTPEGLFKLIVMFFGLMSLPATFQTMMNKILQDLINTREVASFIDNVIVRTEGEEKHNEVIEEVVKRLAESNLYVKLENQKNVSEKSEK